MTAKKKRKKLLLSVTAVILVAALGVGIWFGTQGGGEPVGVYPFQYIGMTEFWGDSQESYGPVTTDKIQTVFLTDTQTVTEIKVAEGDSVKKGDVLLTFDTTLDALSLERKRLEVEKIKVQIKAAGERLEETYDMVPYVPPVIPEQKEDLGDELKEKTYEISENKVYDGKTKETALICWLKEGTPITDALLQELYETSLEYQLKNAEKPKPEGEKQEDSSASAVPATIDDVWMEDSPNAHQETAGLTIKYVFSGEKTGEEIETLEIGESEYVLEISDFYDRDGETYWLTEARRVSDDTLLEVGNLTVPGYPQESGDTRQEWEKNWGGGIELKYTRKVTIEGKWKENDQLVPIPQDTAVQLQVGQPVVFVIQSQIHDLEKEMELEYSVSPADGIFEISEFGNQFFLMGTPKEVTTTPVKYTVTAEYSDTDSPWLVRKEYPIFVSVVQKRQVGEFHVVFKSTQDNYQKGYPTVWQGAKVTAYEDGSFDRTLYDASAFADHTLPIEEELEIVLPEIDPNATYTAEQILEMQKQLNETIKEQKEKLVLAEAEYKIMERELGDGNIYADIDGEVVSLLTEEEAKMNKQPMLKVSGGGGFYIEGSVSELEKEKLKIGQEVTVNDWNTGSVYTGEVVSIGDFPTDEDNWNGMGNPTASYYPFRAFVDGEADLQAGSYVSMTYSAGGAEHGVYLEKAFVRTEKGESYIYAMDSGGKLEKRTVQVGKVLWGSYYEILSGVSQEDLLAFPYGKDVKQGAPAVESDLSTLYGY